MCNNKTSPPEDAAGLFSRLLFSWVSPVLWHGRRQILEIEDVLPLPQKDKSAAVSVLFEREWALSRAALAQALREISREFSGNDFAQQRVRLQTKALARVLWKVASPHVFRGGVLRFMQSTLSFFVPVLLNQLLICFEDLQLPPNERNYDNTEKVGFLFALGMVALFVAQTCCENASFHESVRAGFRWRIATTTAVYTKTLRLTLASRQQRTSGELVNLMQLDAKKLDDFSLQMHVVWDSPYQILAYTTILIYYIGPTPAFVGLGVMMLLMPVQKRLFGKLIRLQIKNVIHTDKRVNLVNEVLNGIKSVKLMSWEEPFEEEIERLRAKELDTIRGALLLRALNKAIMGAGPLWVAAISLLVYAAMGGKMELATLFTALLCFGSLRFPFMLAPMAVAQGAQAIVSVRRLASFLSMDEVGAESEQPVLGGTDCSECVQSQDATFWWRNPDAPLSLDKELFNYGKRRGGGGKGQGRNRTKESAKPCTLASTTSLQLKSISVEMSGKNLSVVQNSPVLQNINLNISRGSLACVVGEVGIGKSALLYSLLGELHRSHGHSCVHGRVAYASQTPWIMNKSVRENILFGKTFDLKLYERVVAACQLNHDLEMLPHGDLTEIGERGVNISGGQKARVSMARVCFAALHRDDPCDVVMMDDVLSALDAEVGMALFDGAIVGLLKEKTRVLTTNSLHVLPSTDHVIVLARNENGSSTIREQGSFHDLREKGGDFARSVSTYGLVEKVPTSKAEQILEAQESTKSNAHTTSTAGSKWVKGENQKQPSKLMQKEERATGAVGLTIYRKYFNMGGGMGMLLLLVLAYGGSMVVITFNQIWIALWSVDADPRCTTDSNSTVTGTCAYMEHSEKYYMAGYGLLAVAYFAVAYARDVIISLIGYFASKNLHGMLVRSVLSAPMSFFDTTPTGRVISRFSSDMKQLDEQIQMFLGFFIFTICFCITSLLSVVAVAPVFAALAVPLACVYAWILQYFRSSNRELKRLDSISRSPVYAHFSETLGGLTTIRAFQDEKRFFNALESLVDTNLECWYTMKGADRWLSMRLQLIACTAIGGAAFILFGSMLLRCRSRRLENGACDDRQYAGLCAFALQFTFSLLRLLQQTVVTYANLENAMNSVERCLHYAENIEQETSPVISNTNKDHNSKAAVSDVKSSSLQTMWLREGGVVFDDVYMKYRESTPLVLHGISFDIKPNERVGICGRTGAGKSSVMLKLFRLAGDGCKGTVFIDNVNTNSIALWALRRKISIIPQDSILFTGSVRFNLDPFGSSSDDELWKSLETVRLKDAVVSLGGLDATVAEGGENFSQGQRQLLALSRVLLRGNKVLLLDEATSSVDHETDAAIQSAIRTKFQCTVITIAHRLKTIIDSDRILVLGDGEALEFGPPAELLAKRGEFFRLCEEMGEGTAEQFSLQLRNGDMA